MLQRVHHPFAGMTGKSDRNPPLPSGDPDPGCILQFRVRLGICKEFGLADPVESFDTWHGEEVPESEWTVAVREAMAKGNRKTVRYNSAHSAGCSCCTQHGEGCPGSAKFGHILPSGVRSCGGRCGVGFRSLVDACPTANSGR